LNLLVVLYCNSMMNVSTIDDPQFTEASYN
jgi:hypothetical protein